MHDSTLLDLGRIAQDLQIKKVQVTHVVELLDAGNTVPFIARYRKERTGGLPEDLLHRIKVRVEQQRQLLERKDVILKSIEGQGKLTEELRAAIVSAEGPRRVEDLYLPYKPRKRTLANAAREKGLEALAQALWNRDPALANLVELLPTMIDAEKGLPTVDAILEGVRHILADSIGDNADVRDAVRTVLWETGKLTTARNETLPEGQGMDYKDYFNFSEPIRHIPPHRILAINRGEKEGPLKVTLQWDAPLLQKLLFEGFRGRPPALNLDDHPHLEYLKKVVEDALARLLVPAIEKEVRRDLTERAQEHAIDVFACNLRSLLLQPPLRHKRVLAIDPGFRTGCKVAVLDEAGNLLEEASIYPHNPQNKTVEAKAKLRALIGKHETPVIAIGNGTACRETEELISDLIGNWSQVLELKPETKRAKAPESPPPLIVPGTIEAAPVLLVTGTETLEKEPPPELVEPEVKPASAEEAGAKTQGVVQEVPPMPPDLSYVIVNEAGAGVYSASSVGREEFPTHDAALRSTISLGRRLQDPLSELVKIDPQNVGVGLYQHDVSPAELRQTLESVVESCVNHVGVNPNTASVSLLRHVSGLNPLVARDIIEFRKQHGPFRSREQLQQVPNLGADRWIQSAGFLRIPDSEHPFDRTCIHPERYPVAEQLLLELGSGPDALFDPEKTGPLREKLQTVSPTEVSTRLTVGIPTLCDILDALANPSYDPRDEQPPPIFRRGILKLEDMKPGMELKGSVLNVVDFGAFVDIGLKDSGLVHISQLANRYIKNPYEVVSVGDVVTVWVMSVDQDRRRVSLTMIQPGVQRRPPERPAAQDRPPRGQRPPRQGDQPPREAQQRRDRPPQYGGRPAVRGPAPAPAASASAPSEAAPATPAEVKPEQVPAVAAQAAPPSAPPPRPRPAPVPVQARPRKPDRKLPKVKLSKSALEGATPLRSLNELAAFFEAKKEEPVNHEPAQPAAPKPEEPAPAPQ